MRLVVPIAVGKIMESTTATGTGRCADLRTSSRGRRLGSPGGDAVGAVTAAMS